MKEITSDQILQHALHESKTTIKEESHAFAAGYLASVVAHLLNGERGTVHYRARFAAQPEPKEVA